MLSVAVHTILLLIGMLVIVIALTIPSGFWQNVLVSLGCNLETTTIVFAITRYFTEKRIN